MWQFSHILIIRSSGQSYICTVDQQGNEIKFVPTEKNVDSLRLNYTNEVFGLVEDALGTEFVELSGVKTFPLDKSKPKISETRRINAKKQLETKMNNEKNRRLLIVENCLNSARQEPSFVESKFWRDNLENSNSNTIIVGYTSSWLGDEPVTCHIN